MKKYIGFLMVLSFFVLGAEVTQAAVIVNTSTAPCVTTANRGNVVVSLDVNSPANMIVFPGSNDVEVLRIALTNTSQENVCLNGIHLGSSENVNKYINKTTVFDVATGLQVGQISYSFSNNGSYYYSWTSPNPSLSIQSGATRVFKVVSDFPTTAIQGDFKMGFWGLNFDRPGSTMSPQVVSGNIISVNNGASNGKPSVTVLSPNGGETYQIGSTNHLTWSMNNFPSWNSNNQSVQIQLWDMSGQNLVGGICVSCTSSENGGSYNWTISQVIGPNDTYVNVLPGQYKIRISTVSNVPLPEYNYTLDFSDRPFAVTNSVISNVLLDGCNSAMGFSPTTGLPCFLDTYSATSITKNGAVLNGRLIANAPAEMYFTYNKTGNGNKVERTPKISQQSNGLFSYTLSSLSPNTSYDFKACMYYAGAERCARQLTFKTFPASYIQEEGDCKINELYSSTTGQKCSTPIELEQKPSITILSPNGGENYRAGGQIEVKWETKMVPSTHELIGMRLRNVNSHSLYSLASNTLNDGREVVTIPTNVPDGSYTLEIKSYLNDVLVMDASDVSFTIGNNTACSVSSAPSITVLSPNGGETFNAGQQVEVKWKSCNIPINTPVSIHLHYLNPDLSGKGSSTNLLPSPYYTDNDGKEVVDLMSASLITANNGKFGKNFKIKLMAGYASSWNITDESEDTLTVNDSSSNSIIQLNSPNGGETYTAGQQVLVKWETKNIPGNIAEINLNPVHGWGGGEGLTFDKDLKNDGQEMVTLPSVSDFLNANSPFGKYYLVEIVAADKNGIMRSDSSNDTFTINKDGNVLPGPRITLLSPQSGSRITAGSTIEVRWESSNLPARSGNQLKMIIKHDGVLVREFKTEDDGREVVTIPFATPNGEYQVEFGTISPSSGGGDHYLRYGSATFLVVTLVNPINCKTNEIYNSATGQKCFNIIEVEQKCDSPAGCIKKEVPKEVSVEIKKVCDSAAGCYSTPVARVLKIGVKGEDVKYIQTLLGIKADGTYGPVTALKVKEWQAKNMLIADGIFGAQSMSVINQ